MQCGPCKLSHTVIMWLIICCGQASGNNVNGHVAAVVRCWYGHMRAHKYVDVHALLHAKASTASRWSGDQIKYS